MAARSKPTKPENQHILRGEVLARERVSPHMLRVTVGGGELGTGFTARGWDQWFRLFVPRPGQDALHLPGSVTLRGYAHYLAMPESRRPLLRNYTVRASRPGQIDIDLVSHGDLTATTPSAAGWAARCEVGSPVALLDEGLGWAGDDTRDWTFVVADESGLPAALGVLASLPDDARGLALLEVPTAEDVQPVVAPAGVEVRWLARDDHHAVPGVLALRTAVGVTLPPGRPYAFVVGEQALAAGVRRHLVAQGVDKGDVTFCGYWRHGARPAR
ncbi:siderophore-interacting protein [Cellulomonas iranensis]|uniref:siderophore-interacting protein n=1 Tax=Cellulomonas iranensis TaxID=76862 RepID=UPI001CF1A8C7|nr:siderophore-interacting protein [Cellulomonas iranensis]UCN15791.1 siderophore-interacting protein [Cellulomonas iranensis]